MQHGNANISYKIQILKLMQYAPAQPGTRKETDWAFGVGKIGIGFNFVSS